ncbi:crotonase/enoyl-CoA hydratase family protein [Congregibacter variabilis]|uniref:Crotonase/enoyl-CoA hydratase family protein n=1 Tax=Congregibacter variabilis TaxID=3081200 RepID=A0ABZ0I4G5_9GAMM|nr:crotonase/enoyl-CoA hydratase family protein [Congregibacter sp. IMCC43200]
MQQEQITQPTFETLELSIDGHVAEVFLNRGDKANSMSVAMWRELQDCFDWLDSEPSVRAVILAAHGKHFCAGIDLDMLAGVQGQNTDPARRAETFRRNVLVMQDNLSAIEKCRKPVLAAIHNTCIGGAMDMVTCADMRYATADAWFSIREVDIGMTADVGTLQRLPKIVPYGVACELAYTGRNMGAEEAQQVGLINRVYADKEALLKGVRETAALIASKAPLAVRGSKEMLLYSRDHSVQEGLNYIATWNAGMLSAHDLQEGLTAQMEKRAANYDD